MPEHLHEAPNEPHNDVQWVCQCTMHGPMHVLRVGVTHNLCVVDLIPCEITLAHEEM